MQGLQEYEEDYVKCWVQKGDLVMTSTIVNK